MQPATWSVTVLAASLALVPILDAQTLIMDFNTTPSGEVLESRPGEFTALPSGDVVFSASTPETGSELWISDGSAGGTQLLADLDPGLPGSAPSQFVALPSGLILFTATTLESGWELWSTDGTTAGTSQVADIRAGSTGSVGVQLTVVGNEVFFFADDGINGIEVWKSNGTAAGTSMMVDLVASGGMSNGGAEMAQLNANEFVFSALINLEWELWKSDGTAAGTTPFYSFNVPAIHRPVYITSFGSKVLFLAHDALGEETRWVSDGTTGGTFSLGIGGAFGPFLVDGSTAYFEANDFVNGSEPWKTDGSIAGTMMIANIATGASQNSSPSFIGAIGSNVIFSARTGGTNYDLYASDGTPAGTGMISGAGSGLPSGTSFGGAFGGDLFFQGSDGTNEGLWRTDGTVPGTSLISPAQPSLYRGFATVNGVTMFSAKGQGLAGEELWMTDGSAAGTQLFKDLTPTISTLDGTPAILATLPNKALLLATDGALGRELFVTDGTTAGTQLLVELEPGPDSLSTIRIASTDRFVLFSSSSSVFGDDPWISDGTPNGTYQLPLSATHAGFKAYDMSAFGDRVIFRAHTDAAGFEPWITDGTLAGTYMLGDLTPGAQDSMSGGFYAWKGKAYFGATTPATSYEPWVTDGSVGGTLMLTEVIPGANALYLPEFTGFGDHVYFNSPYQAALGSELWRSNGTPAGTTLFIDLIPGAVSSNPDNLIVVGDRMVFSAIRNGDRELHTTDGTSTQFISTGPGPLFGPFQSSNHSAGFFRTATAAGGVHYPSIWTTDGTVPGTGYRGHFPEYAGPGFTDPVVISDDRFVLVVGNNQTGRRIWTSDGTAAGSQPLVAPQLLGGYQAWATRVGDRMLYSGDSSLYGTELFSVPLTALGDEIVEHIGYGVAGTNGVPTIDVEGEADASATAPFELVVGNALASSTAIMAWSRDTAAIALPSVTLWTGGTVNALVTGTDLNGRGSFPFTPNPSLAGQRFVAQVFVLDPLGAAFGIASATRGLELVVGP